MDREQPTIKYFDLWGLRKGKYSFLEAHDIKNTKWQALNPKEPYYFFVPKEERGREKYNRFWQITDIFSMNSTGVVTARDNFVIDINKQSLEAKIRIFLDKDNSDEYIKEFLRGILGRKKPEDVENYAWRVSDARKKLKQEKDLEDCFMKILYRPFDERWICYHSAIVWRTRENVMQHMLRPNLALIICRQYSGDSFYHTLVANTPVESCYVSNKTKEIGYVLPLYLYNKKERQPILLKKQDALIDKGRVKKVNLNPDFITNLEKAWNRKFVFNNLSNAFFANDIFYYIYAVLYSNIYRQKYQEFLRIDFPRVPFTKDYTLFKKLAELGNRLVELHLLKAPELNKPVAKFIGKGECKVQAREFTHTANISISLPKKSEVKNIGMIKINKTQVFAWVPKEVWQYMIGGYQVLDKWLKDRKGIILSSDDIKHYCRIITSLSETIKIQKEIDKLYPKIEKNLIKNKFEI